MLLNKVQIAMHHKIKAHLLVPLYILYIDFQTFHICSPICLKFRMCACHIMPFASSDLCEDQRREMSCCPLSSVIELRLRVNSTAEGRAGAWTRNSMCF